jgi:hypothetical protein
MKVLAGTTFHHVGAPLLQFYSVCNRSEMICSLAWCVMHGRMSFSAARALCGPEVRNQLTARIWSPVNGYGSPPSALTHARVLRLYWLVDNSLMSISAAWDVSDRK